MTAGTNGPVGADRTLDTSFEEAVEATIASLKEEGFGVLCDIDVKATLKEKLDVDREPYRILGACNPPLADKALGEAPELGVLLPCNVVVRQVGDQVHVQ
ncbi:MAG: DUF302 domain-containing protein, partial [Candidatus Thermoplasmatota archaeon]|nr:DUF302 domain-containing protein [Candidatus Thermoplasmatota archaeon]